MPRNKKQKTRHNASTNGELTYEEIWDDSALLRSWNDAVKEYEFYHSIHARGEDVEQVLRQAELAESQQSQTQKPTVSNPQSQHADTHLLHSTEAEPSSDEEGEIDESTDQLPLAPPPAPSSLTHKPKPQAKPVVDTMLINGVLIPIEQSPITPTALGMPPTLQPKDGRDFRNPSPGSTAALLREVYGRSPEPASIAQVQAQARRQDEEGRKNDAAMDYDGERGMSAKAGETVEDAAVAAEGTSSGQNQNLNLDQALENIKMAYYWAGYYSGLYDGQRQAVGHGQRE